MKLLTIGDENASYSLFGESNSTVKTIKFNDAVINKNAFKYCTALKTASGADTITKIGDAAFQQTALTSISITKATEIGEWAFANCEKLANVTLCESLTRIPNYCFINAGLIKITIPARITSIGSHAFNNCSKMSTIEFKPATPPSIVANAFAGTPSGLLIKLSVNLQTYTNCLGTFNRYDIGIQPYINQLNGKGFAAGAKVYVSNQSSQISTCNRSGVFTLTYQVVTIAGERKAGEGRLDWLPLYSASAIVSDALDATTKTLYSYSTSYGGGSAHTHNVYEKGLAVSYSCESYTNVTISIQTNNLKASNFSLFTYDQIGVLGSTQVGYYFKINSDPKYSANVSHGYSYTIQNLQNHYVIVTFPISTQK